MAVTAQMILTDFGAALPLNRRRKDALAAWAKACAKREGISPERWVRERFGFKDYEAKEVVRGNASETLWERILYHPNGGWRVVLPILGAVIGQDIGEFFAAEAARARDEAEQHHERARSFEAAERAAGAAFLRLVDGKPADPGAGVAPGRPDLDPEQPLHARRSGAADLGG